MSSLETKSIKQKVINGQTQPLYFGGIQSDNSDAKIIITSDGNIEANILGNSNSATQLQTSRTIAGVTFNGTSNIWPFYFYKTGNNIVGANSTANQSLYGKGINLLGNSAYLIEGYASLYKTAGVTSSFMNFKLGAANGLTIVNLDIAVENRFGATLTAVEPVDQLGEITALDTNLALHAASTTAAVANLFLFKGTIRTNAAGTLVPEYALSAAPGGAWTAYAGNWFKVTYLGDTTVSGEIIIGNNWV